MVNIKFKIFNYVDFSQHDNKLTTVMFTIYSDMFRLTRVIFRLELFLFCNVTVLILGSQTFTCFLHRCYLLYYNWGL